MPSTYDAAFADLSLIQTAQSFSGAGNDATQPSEVRFVRGVARVLHRRLQETGSAGEAPSVFLLHPNAPPAVIREPAQRCRMLDNGRTPVDGRLWLVSPVVASGWHVPLSFEDDDDVFKQVADEYKLGDVPAVIYDPRTSPSEIRLYQRGLDEPDERVIVPLQPSVVTLDEAVKVIDRLYHTKLITPDAQSETAKLWENPARHWPTRLAEQTVQMYVETALFIGFPHCAIRREQPQVSGRLDLEIEGSDPFDPESFVRYLVLELKVLRSYSHRGVAVSNGRVNTWIDEGVDQASAYARERRAKGKALCCFDMRKENAGHACFAYVEEKARRLDVALKVWYLYSTAKLHRRDLAEDDERG